MSSCTWGVAEAVLDADATSLALAKTMAGYDDAIDVLTECADPVGAAYVRRRKHELERATRGADMGLMLVAWGDCP